MSDPQRPSDDEDKTVEQPAETPASPPAAQPVVAPRKSGFRRFAAARATQLVAVGLLGFILGGGVIGTAVGLAVGRHGDRPGIAREHRGPDGHGAHRDFRDGPGDRGWRHDGN
ncbi:hypothetical protein BS329_27030 [Amycolatopsis coloradensis]|uniref:Uncharacterized protein n=1 Tax=Amycolatopsis coloradensis TaxID=76021 RepID=A0A1R0KLQ2_9PSEU|nr:hypothetical protein [Amycolatopsis coloradensis]OLZ47562.1 hypothetical protein BS329_27030 [Amycolatopsis coloradensis]